MKKKAADIDLLEQAVRAGMDFLKRASRECNARGISHSYSFWLNPDNGWRRAYPEVTGYTIPTLLNASKYLHDDEALRIANSCANWLVAIQDVSGGFYGGTEPANGLSLFNTAMILFGLKSAYQNWGNEDYQHALSSAIDWIIRNQDVDGRFTKYAYYPGFQPAYYTRVAWALLNVRDDHDQGKVNSVVGRLIETLAPDINEKGIVNSGFRPRDSAFLHTVAYTLRGAYEVNQLLPGSFDLDYLDLLADRYHDKGKWPGEIGFIDGEERWDTTYRCLTGEAQIAILLMKYRDGAYADLAERTIDGLRGCQAIRGPARGGLPGSVPYTGPYMRLRYPSWATKFLVDALMELIDLKKRT